MKNTIIICLLLAVSAGAFAVPIEYVKTPNPTSVQDPLPDWTHELGIAFPADELICASWEITTMIACTTQYDPQGHANVLVTMTNLTNTTWYDVTYVADPETTITNDDLELVNNGLAFLIDYDGANRPLVYESMSADAVFQPGETWKFILQNYSSSLGLLPSAFTSWDPINNLGLIGDQSSCLCGSSGSIIAVPEPLTVALLGIGGLMLRKKK